MIFLPYFLPAPIASKLNSTSATCQQAEAIQAPAGGTLLLDIWMSGPHIVGLLGRLEMPAVFLENRSDAFVIL
jgi:hypothetical protein